MENIKENNNLKIDEEFIKKFQSLGKSLENLMKEETKEKRVKFEVEITRTEDGEKVEYLCGTFDSLDKLVTNIDDFVKVMRIRPKDY